MFGILSHGHGCANKDVGVAQNETIGGANRRFWSMFPLTRAAHFGIPAF